MKEKRYYCDWILSPSDEKSNHLFEKVVLISFVIVTAISSLIYYINIIVHNYTEDLEAYYESAYKYLYEIADNVIERDGIKEAAIPEDVVEYEITYKDGEIIFKYCLDNSKEKEFVTSASMTVTLSEDFKVLSKKPNFSSKEEYVKRHKIAYYIFVPMVLGALIWIVMAIVGFIVSLVAIPISKMHKKRDMKKNLS